MVAYVNTKAEVKTLADVRVTSANAVEAVSRLPEDRAIYFVPDMFLGAHVTRATGRKMDLFLGECHVHAGFHRLKKEAPEKAFFPVKPDAVCEYMKRIALEKVYLSLKEMRHAIRMPEEVAKRARRALEAMVHGGRGLMERLTADLLILGAGVAGVYAALAAKERGARVLLASKDPLPAGSTPWAQGGVAFPVGEEDLEAHLRDTLTAGRGLVEEGVARSILEEAPRHLERLRAFGLPFHPEPTREGGHSRARVFHLGGDRSGLLLLQGLLERLSAP